ncbi:hypothetical protein CELL_02818 [Cellulomonas sp. T2.31MG-18]|uniref:YciI family protein n=1 Tax=Cellulomonas sp. T2.31MG-18 TaxID=3157619 RepID=UPI0035EC2322
MTTYAVRYTYDERADVLARFRPEHRAWLARQAERGALLGSGPFTEGEPGALLVFRAADPQALADLLAQDPLSREGLVRSTEVRVWDVILGPWSATV